MHGKKTADMRSVNMEHYKVLVQGQEWHRDTPPCSREASQVLENNEAFVSWLAPRDALRVFSQHVPAILYQGKYWTISLRMSKSIYRSVRLRKGFYNVQTVHGVQTLRIPQLLFNEKQRTQARFKEMNAKSHSALVPRKRKSNKANPPCSKKRHAATYTGAVLEMLQEAEKTVHALEAGEHILPRYMHSDIHEFVGRVCDELFMLYPGASADYNSILRTFKHHLEQRAHPQTNAQTRLETSTPAQTPAVGQ